MRQQRLHPYSFMTSTVALFAKFVEIERDRGRSTL
jgi:hypothetical protein